MNDLPGYGQPPADQPGFGQPGYGGQLPRYGQPTTGQPSGGGPTGYGPSLPPIGGWAAPAPMPGGVPLRPLSVGDMLSGAFTLIRRNPVATLGLAAIVETASAVVTTFLTWSEQRLTHQLGVSLTGNPSSTQVGHAFGHFFSSFAPYLFLTIAVTFIAQTVLTGMLTGALGRGLIGDKITISQAWQIARIPTVLALSLLVPAIALIPWVVFGLIVFGLAAAHLGPLAVLVGVVGGIALFVATVWVSVRLLLAVPVAVLEVTRPVAALRRSWQLVGGSWWRVFGISLLTAIVVAVIAGIIEIPFAIARFVVQGGGSGLTGLASTAKPTLAALIVGAIGGIIASTCTRPISAGVSVLLYADLRMRNEGLDLVLQQAGQQRGMSGAEFANLWQAGPGQPGPGQPGQGWPGPGWPGQPGPGQQGQQG